MINPSDRSETSDIKIEIYQEYDEATGELSKLSDTESFVIEKNSFTVEVKTMEEASITTSNGFVGESTDNVATFTFTPITPISSVSGKIEIETPVWASQYLRKKFDISYAVGDDCTSEQFTLMTQTVTDAVISLNYEGYLG